MTARRDRDHEARPAAGLAASLPALALALCLPCWAIAVGVAGPADAFAQTPGGARPSPASGTGAGAAGEPGPRKRGGNARMLLVLRISEALDLDEAETIRVATQLRAMEGKRTKLLDEKLRLEASLERELDRQPPDAAKLEELTAQLLDLERKLLLLPDAAFESLLTTLTVEQRAKLLLLRARLKKDVLSERERRSLDHPDGPSGGPGAGPGQGPGPRRGFRRPNGP